MPRCAFGLGGLQEDRRRNLALLDPDYEEPDFYALELIRDNQNRSVTIPSFREDFKNTNDNMIG